MKWSAKDVNNFKAGMECANVLRQIQELIGDKYFLDILEDRVHINCVDNHNYDQENLMLSRTLLHNAPNDYLTNEPWDLVECLTNELDDLKSMRDRREEKMIDVLNEINMSLREIKNAK